MLQRTGSGREAEEALTKIEIHILGRVVRNAPGEGKDLRGYLKKLARLGGYLARGSDPAPGNRVMCRGLSRLNDIHLGFLISRTVGN